MVSPTQGQVAHALLTRPPLGIATSFDLNVLCTPPAFILSQDQTLEQIVSQVLRLKTFFPSSLWLVLLVLSMCPASLQDISFKEFPRFSHSLFSLVLLSPVVQFSMINFTAFLRQPCYYSTLSPLCQHLFGNFIDIFSYFWVTCFGEKDESAAAVDNLPHLCYTGHVESRKRHPRYEDYCRFNSI